MAVAGTRWFVVASPTGSTISEFFNVVGTNNLNSSGSGYINLGAIAGVALGILASKVYEKFKNKNNANNSEILRNNLINTLIKANIFKPESNNKEYLNKFDTATLQKTHDKYINV